MALAKSILCFVFVFLLPITQIRMDNSACIATCTCIGNSMDCRNTSASFALTEIPPRIKHLDLSYSHSKVDFPRSLANIPSVTNNLSNLSSLVLSHNQITALNGSILSLINLRRFHSLDLSNNHIQEIPPHIFPANSSLQVLNLNNNGIRTLQTESFINLTQLVDLRLSKNKLKVISKEAFKQLKNLQSLDLNRNQLVKLESLTFTDLVQLSTLRLRRNNITYLEDGVFWNLKNITVLQLDHNNVEVISKKWLYGLDSLRHLNLSYNRVKQMEHECWSFNNNLQELDLSFNHLQSIGKNTFNHLSKLMKLRVNNNHIFIIEENSFSHSPILQILDLSNNQLKWGSQEMNGVFNNLSDLKYLSLFGNSITSIHSQGFNGVNNLQVLNIGNNSLLSVQENPWSNMLVLEHLLLNSTTLMCDCSLSWLPVWLRSQTFEKDIHATCAYPPILRGMSIMHVAPENFSCEGIPNPHITEDPKTQTALKGTKVVLYCRANSSSDESLIFRWKRNYMEIANGNGVEIRYHPRSNFDAKEQTSELRIENASLSDGGIYQCFVSNSFGSAHSKKANVSIMVFPRFTKIPEDLQVKTGSIARLPCAADGVPEPKMSWQKDGGNDFPAARERRMHVMPDDDVFFITNVKPVDMGVYSCTARNEAGQNITNVSLTILEVPFFLKGMENKEVNVGQAVVLECVCAGFPKPVLTWKKDGVVLAPSDRYYFAAEDELLIIRNTQPEDAGRYECELKNALGIEQGFSKLTILPVSNGILSDDDLIGIIIMTAVCCAVLTSVVWVIIIYVTRKNIGQPTAVGAESGGSDRSDNMEGGVEHPLGQLLVYGHPGGHLTSQNDTESEHSSGKDSGTGDSVRRTHSHEELLPVMLQNRGSEIQMKTSDDREDEISDSELSSPALQQLVGPQRSPSKPPVLVASVKRSQRQRRSNHDRCAVSRPTATVHSVRPSSYRCLPISPTAPPPQEV